MKSRIPATRAQLIERSLRCFRSGLLGLIPLLGVPFAARACVEYLRLRRPREGLWNPASGYLRWSLALSGAGLLLTLLLGLWMVIAMTQSGGADVFRGGDGD